MNSTASSFVRGLVVIGVIVLAGLLFLATPGEVQAGACVTTGVSSSWIDSAAWTGCDGATPASADTVTISHNVTLNTNASVGDVTVTAGTLTVGGGVTPQVLTSSGNLLLTGGAVTQGASNSAISVAGNITIQTGATLTSPTNISLSGDWVNGGTFNHNNGSITFTGGTSDISGTTSTIFNQLIFSAPNVTFVQPDAKAWKVA